MLLELHVCDLGVIADLTLRLGPGMTAITGETGAGKTLVVEAIELLVGLRPDPGLVRQGAAEARVEGRFELDGDELVLARTVPRTGRSRAYVNGRLAAAAELAELGGRLVDLHGQHAHQSLLGPGLQRAALDAYGGVDLAPLRRAAAAVAAVDEALAGLGGDARSRAREIDLLEYQVAELAAAALTGPDEDDDLAVEEDVLADAAAHRDAGAGAHEALAGDEGVVERLGTVVTALAGRRPYAELEHRLRTALTDVIEASGDLRQAVEGVSLDPERLAGVRARRRLLGELRRKYGERLSDVLDYQREATQRLAELRRHDDRVRELEASRAEADAERGRAATVVAEQRRRAAPGLARAVEERLRILAMPGARFDVAVDGPEAADDVRFLLGANPGEPLAPLASVASGGELARTMLALRLVLTQGPPCLVFDEVDAGIGGEAALAVGRALAALTGPAGGAAAGTGHQVVVVTHLPQVAAFADHQVVVAKEEAGGRTVARARTVEGPERVVELSRMLSGQPASSTAREHAAELLAAASRERGA